MHFLFYSRKIIFRKTIFRIKVVVKTGLNGRTDGDLDIFKEASYGLCHNVRGRMAQRILSCLRIKGQKFHVRSVDERHAQIRHFIVYFSDENFSGQAVADLCNCFS